MTAMHQANEAVISWIKAKALPLRTLDPHAPLDDLAPLAHIVGNASLVALGEASHGGHEFFVMKHRLLRFLVEHLGFTLFAMEMSWMQAEAINDYVLTGIGEGRTLLRKNGYGIWNTEEVLELIEWIRTYNTDPAHTRKLHFAGFDSVVPSAAGLEQIVQYFQVVDPPCSAQIAEHYQHLSTISYRNLPERSIRQHYLEGAEQVCDLLQEHADAYIARSSSATYDATLQAARVVRQAVMRIRYGESELDLQSEEYRAVGQERDHFMAENVQWLFEHAEAGTKMVLWAHNWHIGTWGEMRIAGTNEVYPFTWMGMDLRQRYENAYLTLGFSFFEGSHQAVLIDTQGKIPALERRVHLIGPAHPESYPAELHQAGSLYLLDLRHLPAGEAGSWLTGPHPFRDFGAEHIEDGGYHTLSLPAWFDVLLHIESISPTHLLPTT